MKEPYLLRIPTETKARLTAKAEEIGISLNALILQILWAYFEGGAENGNRKSDGE